MKISRLTLRNYRNYENESVEFCPGINVFIGENAQGKTNILEAIYYAALGRSHRTSSDGDLIRNGTDEAFFSSEFTRMDAENRLDFRFNRGMRRRIEKNGASVTMKDLIGTLQAVLFSPEDLFLVKGGPGERRRFIDMELSQVDKNYFFDLAGYSRLIAQRNSFLKKVREGEASEDDIFLWDRQIIPRAVRITVKRIEALKKIGDMAKKTHEGITGGRESLSVKYEIHGAEGEREEDVVRDLPSWYNEKMAESRKIDIMRGSTRFGPHRDDFIFSVNGENLRFYGSQGQQRTGILSLKMAELSFFTEEAGEPPVLLLDDVMSELDRERREKLISFIGNENLQAMVTTTDGEHFPKDAVENVYRVSRGTVKRI